MEQLIVQETISDILHNIVCRISTNTLQVADRGLLNGKMGMAIFLYHYSGFYNDAACTQLADDFIKDIRNNMIEITSVDYYNGLSGIEASLKYLHKNGCIDAGMAKMPEMAQQAIYNSLFNLGRYDKHDYLYRLSLLGKYFMQDDRRKSLVTVDPVSDANRQGVSHVINLLSLMDVALIARQHYRNVLRLIDVLSQVYTTGFRVTDVHQFLSHALQVLEPTIFGNADFKPFNDGCNPFCIVLALLQIYDRTSDQRFVTFAMRLLKEFEGTVNTLYTVKDIRDVDLLQHVIACKKLQRVLMDDYFGNCAVECLEFYRERKNSNHNASQYNNREDYSLGSGYAGEGMALLTLEGNVGLDWLEDLLGYY